MARYETDGSSAMAPQEEESPFLHLVKNEMSPDLPGKEGVAPDGSRKKNQKVIDFNEARQQMLGKEKAAAEDVSGDNSGGIDGARNSEAVSPVNYTGKGKIKGDKNKKSKGRGFWRSGYAAVCKTAYTGSIPVGTSIFYSRYRDFLWFYFQKYNAIIKLLHLIIRVNTRTFL